MQYVSTNILDIALVDGTPSSAQQTIDGIRICDITALFILHGVNWRSICISNVFVCLLVVWAIEHLFLTLLPGIPSFVIIELSM